MGEHLADGEKRNMFGQGRKRVSREDGDRLS